MTDAPLGHVVIPKYLVRLEKGAKINHIKGKMQSPAPAASGTRTCWELSSWKGAWQKKALGILVDAELNLQEQCALVTKEADGPWAPVDKVLPADQGR